MRNFVYGTDETETRLHLRDQGWARAKAVVAVGAVIAIATVLLVALLGGTWSSTNTSAMTCVYNGGPVDNRNFRGFEAPGAGRRYQGWMSEIVDVPVGVRQYRVSLNPEQGDTPEADSIKARVKGYEMTFEPTVTFTLSTEIVDGKPAVCEFIEKQLRQFDAVDFDREGGSWQFKFLNERFRPILNDTATRVLQTYDPGDLKFNLGSARDRAAEEIGVQLNTALIRSLGGDYFCAPDYTFNAGAEQCKNILTVILPEPFLSADDEAQLSQPQRAKIEADNQVAAANEAARAASSVAAAKETEADSAERLANANAEIATQNARVQAAQAVLDYAWCTLLVDLAQDCALVKAAENGDFPTVFDSNASVVVPIPTDQPSTATEPPSTVPAP